MSTPKISKHRVHVPRQDPEDAKIKISLINRYLDILRRADFTSTKITLHNDLGTLLNTLEQSKLFSETDLQRLVDLKISAEHTVDEFFLGLGQLRQQLDNVIADRQTWYFTISYELYNSGKEHDSVEHILNRRFNLSDAANTVISGRLALHAKDWRMPGAVIRPGLESWHRNLAASLSPMYFIDHDWELMEPIKQHFPQEFLDRLRLDMVHEHDHGVNLDCLPDHQLGFVLAYNFFNYKPFEITTFYLEEIMKKLRPGGILAFTFNDGDRPGGAELVERRYACYTPGSMIQALADRLGYKVSWQYHIDAAVTWIELQRPGDLDSIRAGATLTKIFDKP